MNELDVFTSARVEKEKDKVRDNDGKVGSICLLFALTAK